MAKKKQSLVNEELPVNEVVQEELLEETQDVVEPTEHVDELKAEQPLSARPDGWEEEHVDTPEEETAVEPQKVIEEFNEAAKNIDSFVTNATTQEELNEKLESELKRASSVEEQLEKQIADLEKKVSPEMKRGFTQFWMGTSEGWFN